MNIGACKMCACAAFAPQYWRDHKCRDCFHPVMEHASDTFATAPDPVVDESTNAGEEKMSHRDRVAKEILSSERTYVENMNNLIEVYLVPLRVSGDISPAAIASIFSNIEEIVHVNREMLSSLEDRINHWSATQRIGDVLLNLTPFLKMYTSYTAGYDASIAAVKECEKSSTFREFLQRAHDLPKCKALDLRSFLIQPVQRIPRYNMLLEDLIKHTHKEHVDYEDLRSALAKMKVVANDINEAIRICENRTKVLAVQKSFISEVDLIAPHRMYVREGVLTKVCRKSNKRYTFFLFSDVLIYASTLPNGRYVFHRMTQLESCRLEDVPDSASVQNAFYVIGQQKSFLVFTDVLQQKIDWLLDLTAIINKLREKRMTFRRGQSPFLEEVISEAPVWVPDQAARSCSLCGAEFTVLRRRHHCRACGALVCKTCSAYKLLLPTIDAKKRVRVCGPCHENLTNQQEEFLGLVEEREQQRKESSEQKQQEPPALPPKQHLTKNSQQSSSPQLSTKKQQEASSPTSSPTVPKKGSKIIPPTESASSPTSSPTVPKKGSKIVPPTELATGAAETATTETADSSTPTTTDVNPTTDATKQPTPTTTPPNKPLPTPEKRGNSKIKV